jgi:inhibitor of cysteine peptidase
MKEMTNLAINFKTWFFVILAVIFLSFLLFITLPFVTTHPVTVPQNGDATVPPMPEFKIEEIERFTSKQEFEAYLTEAMALAEDDYYGLGFDSRDTVMAEPDKLMIPLGPAPEMAKEMPERYSETNVQVEGVDEPDIVKTDGVNIYFSSESPYYWPMRDASEPMPIMDEEIMIESPDYIMPKPKIESKTKIIEAFPAENLALISNIDKIGKLLLKDNILVIFEQNRIIGYNVADPKSPEQKWEIKIDSQTRLTAARLYGDTVYLITSNRIQSHRPCIIEPLVINGNPMKVECTSIYYPRTTVPVDTTYNVAAINLASGEAEKTISFVGSASNSVIYVSLDNIYISYYQQKPIYEFLIGFFKDECKDILPSFIVDKLERLEGYDIGSRAKTVEIETIMEDWSNSLDPDDELRIENELTNRMPEYYEKNMRRLESTGIIKIGISNLQIKAAGSVPGSLLNQFAMDEYNGNLRVATTIGERSWFGRGFMSLSHRAGILSANDVYVLDENLGQLGSIRDLGLEERIYSARFIQDKGYLVTFREIDPFYILDLSNPRNPEMKGELKIPGYSSYLHPISKNRILGIGREDRNVKISLFDVSDPYNPQEIDKYFLNEYWSEILSNHHAFLLDTKYEIFFLPGNKGAYIFSYAGDKISLTRTVKETQVKRALYIDDYLYIVSTPRIVVLDQNNWETVAELDL